MTQGTGGGSPPFPAEAAYRTLFDRIQDGVYTVDREGRFTFVNAFIERSSGFPASAFLGRSYLDFIRPEDRDRVRRHFEAALAGDPLPPYELAYRAATTGEMWVEVTTSPLVEGGEIVGVLGLSRNIQKRKAAELALRESEAKYRSLVESLPLGVCIGQDGRVVFANSHFLSTLGLSSLDDERLSNAIRLLAPDQQAVVGDRLRRRLAGETGLPSRYEVTLQSAGDVKIEAEVVVAVTTYRGRPAVQCVVIDLSDRLKMEAQLRQSQKLDAIGTLAGGVAHDFNNLLAAILGSAYLLDRRHGDVPGVADLTGVITKAGDRAASLTRQLLNFARRNPTSFEPTDLNSVVADVIQILRRTVDMQVSISYHADARHPVVLGDSGQLQQVALNLAINARDAMPDGGRLVVTTHDLFVDGQNPSVPTELAPGPYVVLSVCDTGVGIPPEIVPRIFEPFFSTKPTGEGTGMGLAVAYGIVKSHRGTVHVDSMPGCGTTFTVYLPGAGEQAAQEALPIEEVRGRGTILFVDDEEMVRATAKHLLTALGYDVVPVGSGAAALEHLSAHGREVDLVILDFTMPGMNGEQSFHAIREFAPELPIIMSSGHGPNQAIRRLLRSGARGFIEKPYSQGKLSVAVAGALADSQAR